MVFWGGEVLRCVAIVGILVAAVGLASVIWSSQAQARIVEGDPARLSETESLADLIKPKTTLRIVYVHGMRAEGPGASDTLAGLLRSKLRFVDNGPVEDEMFDLGAYPHAARYLDQQIWKSSQEWAASRPFVRRTRLVRDDEAQVIIDEVNWWPLLFPLKCRLLILPEHDLSGNDDKHIELCSRPVDGDHYYPWLNQQELDWLKGKPKGGKAALANRFIKQQIMNWGLSDAVIALGPMRVYINKAMDLSFDFARRDAGARDTFVVMAESLGSFAVLDSMALGAPAVKDVLDRTDDLYLFANQFALLELGRLQGLPPALDADTSKSLLPPAPPSPLQALAGWAGGDTGAAPDLVQTTSRERPRQIIAFSDPSDALTYIVPRIQGVTVVNLFDRNATSWFGLVENPIAAHTGHLRNKAVWRVLSERRHPE